MASSHPEQQVVWATASSKTLSSSARADSDEVAFNVEDWSFDLQLSADNQGTPASGDVLNVYIKWSTGDILGDSGNDYDTDEHATFITQLDTYSTNTPGEDPARRTIFGIPRAGTACKVSVDAPNAGTRNIVVRARIVTHRGQ